MKIVVETPSSSVMIDNSVNDIVIINKGDDGLVIGRAYYYLTKSVYLLPRLYGISAKDPITDWKNMFKKHFTSILSNELSVAKINLNNVDFKIQSDKLTIVGNIRDNIVNLDVDLKSKPAELDSTNIAKALVAIDSYYFSSLVKRKPYIVPAIRAGLIASFYRFLPIQFESSPGIPKTLGLISDFINSMILPQGYSEEVLGHRIYIKDNDLYCDNEIIYNANPKILSLFPIIFYVKNSEKDSVIVIEHPEAYIKDSSILSSIFKKAKAKIVLVTDMQ